MLLVTSGDSLVHIIQANREGSDVDDSQKWTGSCGETRRKVEAVE